MSQEQNIIVRADFYPNGGVIPLGITYSNGKSKIINQILEVKKTICDRGVIEYKFKCKSNDSTIHLSLKNNIWTII